ncbi:MAG: hypothetical protein K2K09_03995 [Lachnospiraceae bacterium]|nr:hypothetical protein [Lachnospiraceae bacterium]
MSKNRKIGIGIWFLAFALSVFLLFVIPKHYMNSIYTTLIFDGIAFMSTLILWLSLFRSVKTSSDVFYCSPAMTASMIYLVIQFVVCIVVAFLAESMPFKVILIVNFMLMVIMWILIFSTISAKDHAQSVDSRQKDHHVEL